MRKFVLELFSDKNITGVVTYEIEGRETNILPFKGEEIYPLENVEDYWQELQESVSLTEGEELDILLLTADESRKSVLKELTACISKSCMYGINGERHWEFKFLKDFLNNKSKINKAVLKSIDADGKFLCVADTAAGKIFYDSLCKISFDMLEQPKPKKPKSRVISKENSPKVHSKPKAKPGLAVPETGDKKPAPNLQVPQPAGILPSSAAEEPHITPEDAYEYFQDCTKGYCRTTDFELKNE